jgi:hypothetical protein
MPSQLLSAAECETGGLGATSLGAKIMYKLFLILIVSLNAISFSQNNLLIDTSFSVNSVKVNYREYLTAKAKDIYSYDLTLVKIDVISSKDSIIQTFELPVDAIGSPFYTNDPYCILGDSSITLDYNFDGLEDLALRFNNGPNNHAVNGYYYIYLFNPKTKHFDKYNEELTNPIPIPDKKKVDCTYIYSTAYPHTLTELYEWVNGKLEITESIEYQQLDEQSEKGVILTKETIKLYKEGLEIKKTESVVKDSIH